MHPEPKAPARQRGAVAPAGIGSALTSWWLIGHQSLPHRIDRTDLTYIFGPWAMPAAAQLTLGLVGVALVIGAVATLAGQRSSRGWWVAAALAAASGLTLGDVERTTTAGVVGSPIGGVLSLFLELPFALALAALSTFLAWVLGRKQRAHPLASTSPSA